MKQILILSLFCLFIISSSGIADSNINDDVIVQAIRLQEPVIVDGLLTESVWQNGHAFDRFIQRDPNEGNPATEKTEVRVAYDDDALYVAARMYDSAPDSIIGRLSRRDSWDNSDNFIFFIDPYHDKRSGYFFSVNAAGTIGDGVLMNDDWDDDSWDGVWQGEVHVDDQGWTAEMRIPYSQLRFHKKEKYTWAVNFRRDIQRKNEKVYVVFTPKDGSGFVSRFVDLVGIEHIRPVRQVEMLPYFRTKAEYTHPESDDPFNDGSKYVPGIGTDIKLGIGNNLTLDMTVNPDFGQVEVDPAVVNLSDIETFYSEKRPFFIEGANIFNFGQGGATSYWGFNWSNPDFFYSRRIGRNPQGSLPDYDFVDLPQGTKILGAAKLSGKLDNKWNIGTLHALTAKESAEISYSGDKSKTEIEPMTYYGIFRGQKEFNDSRQGFGIISTIVNRKFDDIRLKDEINSDAYTLGFDGWTFLDTSKTWVISGWTGMTHVRGSQTRIIDLQRSSRHYFQRPDANHVNVDSSATSITGYAARFWLNKQKGNVIFNSALGFIDPKFDLNDVGFMWRGDVINGHIGGGYKWTKPNKVFRFADIIGAVFQSYDFDKNLIWRGLFALTELQFLNYYYMEIMLAYNPETISNRQTRGGPLMISPPGYETNVFIKSDDRKPWIFGLGTFGYNSDSGSWSREIEFDIEWKPVSNVSLTLSPGYSYDHTNAQWVDYFEDPTATNTFGNRYVFAQLDHRTLSSSIRLDWTFSPKLSFQLYAQPLISSGNYYDFKELAKPKSYEFNEYNSEKSEILYLDSEYSVDPDKDGPAAPFTFSNPDFNYKSIRGNAVLRWEYSPGSTLYFVWTQSRSDAEEFGEFRFRKSISRLIDTKADNIFMIKMSYWFGL